MNWLVKIALTASLCVSAVSALYAQTPPDTDAPQETGARSVARRFEIWYRLDRIDIDEHYLDNERQLAEIKKYLLISPKIDSITI